MTNGQRRDEESTLTANFPLVFEGEVFKLNSTYSIAVHDETSGLAVVSLVLREYLSVRRVVRAGEVHGLDDLDTSQRVERTF